MAITHHQAKYFAYELTRRFPSDSEARLAGALVDAVVDLNPHQVDAALFAFRSPLAKGALLADEVGLGKTIEAGLVISQRWAERRRKILVVTPANLRKQWFQELTEKFSLPCRILEARSYNAAIKSGRIRPFDGPDIVICSYQFARGKEPDVSAIPWDLVVIDEAHRLRNVYKSSNVIANSLKRAFGSSNKLLLTATPLQNSLLELYGLVSFIDEHAFGDLRSFREQFLVLDDDAVFKALKARLQPVCHRTLRRQVAPYVSYTQRRALVQDFTPDESEDRLYDAVSEYLQRPNLLALPAQQRTLITLVLRKLLASSTFAIAGALRTMADGLREKLRSAAPTVSVEDELGDDYEALDESADEWEPDAGTDRITHASRAAIEKEIADLDAFAALAGGIQHNAKGRALLTALKTAFAEARKLGAAEKAIIFTESRRTQQYLLRVLADGGYASEDIVLFNGSNTDDSSKAIYSAWTGRHAGTDRLTGSRTADMRSALVDQFRECAQIMIATEAAAEGINLQFCSLVVNYDLPWNPQRIEQRIGRCHRYGQKHDVVVVNFLNRKNAADVRVFELLSVKFRLFEGIFGSSDEVLGAIESGVDFEKRIATIYQDCRHPDDIKAAFDKLQLELSLEIDETMTAARRKLLEHFDDEVREKLKMRHARSTEERGRFEELLMALTRHELADVADFANDGTFVLRGSPDPATIPAGKYELPRRSGESHLYRLGHPLAESVVACAKERPLSVAAVEFNRSAHDGKVSALDELVGRCGWLSASLLSVESFDRQEDHAILVARLDDGTAVDPGVLPRLLRLPAVAKGDVDVRADVDAALRAAVQRRRADIELGISERNAKFFEEESTKLDGWADDLKLALERELKELDRKIKEVKRSATAALTLEERLAVQKEVRSLESQRNEKRKRLFDAQDDVDRRRGELIEQIEAKLRQQTTFQELFTIRWSLCA
jgi:adenine-specific DNA-methyltransferase